MTRKTRAGWQVALGTLAMLVAGAGASSITTFAAPKRSRRSCSVVDCA